MRSVGRIVPVVLAVAALVCPAPATAAGRQVRILTIHYRAHNGDAHRAFVVLPAWYRPRRDPPIPLIISPHGRGVTARANTAIWGALPARGAFAVVSPEGQGRKLRLFSWGSAGQIDDLARMPVILHRTLPWVHVDRHRIYAFGGSMGGQETLLLLARHPHLLAGAAAFDAVSNFALQYRSFPQLPCNRRCLKTEGPLGRHLQQLARKEIGGTPKTRPLAYEQRSPLTYARTIAGSCVPLQLWWSVKDRIVVDQRRQTGALYRDIDRLNPDAPVTAFVGTWNHSAEMHAKRRLPAALALFGLLPPVKDPAVGLHLTLPPDEAGCQPGPASA
ncbi:MAG: alpha/beta hydrolase family protein [Gaiellaceae bacterium]